LLPLSNGHEVACHFAGEADSMRRKAALTGLWEAGRAA
jgi:hypothetical protein